MTNLRICVAASVVILAASVLFRQVVFVQASAAQQERIALLVGSVDGVLTDVEMEVKAYTYTPKETHEFREAGTVELFREDYANTLRLVKKYEAAGQPNDSMKELLELRKEQLRKAEECLAQARSLDGDGVEGSRGITISVADGIMRVHHSVEASPVSWEAFEYTDQWEYGKKYEFVDSPAATESPRNVIITDIDHQVNPFRTSTAFTLGRGISYYLGAPMDLVANEEEQDCYTLLVWDSERSNIVARFVLDKSKGFCWKKAEIYEEGPVEPTIVAECSDFRESAGVYLPFHCVYKYYGHLGEEKKRALVDRSTYDVTSFSSATVAADLSAEKLIQPDDVVIKPVPAGER